MVLAGLAMQHQTSGFVNHVVTSLDRSEEGSGQFTLHCPSASKVLYSFLSCFCAYVDRLIDLVCEEVAWHGFLGKNIQLMTPCDQFGKPNGISCYAWSQVLVVNL